MARPPKTGLNYFPLDVDFFDNPKICAVAVEHGAKGQATVIMLLSAVYRNGYYIDWTPENCVMILRQLPGVSFEEIQKIVKTLVDWDFFDRTIFEQHHVLTSKNIQQRFLIAARRRKYAADISNQYWIEENIETMNEKTADEANQKITTPTSKQENEANKITQKPGLLSTETPEKATKTTQKNNKKIIKNYNYPSSSPTPTREVIEQLKNNQSWKESICMRHHLSLPQLEQLLEEFVLDCECRGKPAHDSVNDTQNHFCNWLVITLKQQLSQNRNNNPSKTYNHATNYQTSSSAEYIEEAQRWAIERTMQFLKSPKGGGGKIQRAFPF